MSEVSFETFICFILLAEFAFYCWVTRGCLHTPDHCWNSKWKGYIKAI